MKVAGFGFRSTATINALRDALAQAGGALGLTALATASDKATAPAIRALAAELNLPLLPIASEALHRQSTITRSTRIAALYGTGSLAEAAALAAVGTGGQLTGPRAVSADLTATAAIATRTTP